MAPFYPLYVRRSDGKVELKAAKGSKELNEPLPSQLDQTPNAQGVSDYYRQCQQSDPKEVDWRRKLAGMLMRELEGKDSNTNKNYLLAALPENYRLFEHVKCKTTDGVDKVKVTKHHAAGGNERQDAYLYGHPQGRKKRYRSPAEFFPHLLWLATDEAGDPNNCSCKFCSPEELDDKQNTKNAVKEVKAEPSRSTPDVATKATKPTAPPPQQLPPRQTPQPIANPQIPQNLQPTPLPQPQTQQQATDMQYNGIIYRPGEIVWFARGAAWGLGVITKRTSHSRPIAYTVQPLSHPMHHPPTHTLLQEQLRPWLAWSPPPCTHRGLNPNPENNNRISTYNTVDWAGVRNGQYGDGGDAEVDGSILSVKHTETTFTPFGLIPGKSSLNLNYYNGIYVGGEKIWVGDPVRMRSNLNNHNGTNTDMMILQEIVETPGRNPTQTRITLVGDIYINVYATYTEGAALPKPDMNLPPRVREDLQYRNSITSQASNPAKRITMSWRLASKGARVTIPEIKGRWYESSILGPVLDVNGFNRARSHGEVMDTGLCMNAQGDCNRPFPGPPTGYKPADTKTKTREETFGQAVPPNFKVDDGDGQNLAASGFAQRNGQDGSQQMEIEPKKEQQPSAQQQQQQQHQQRMSEPVAYHEVAQKTGPGPQGLYSPQAFVDEQYGQHQGQRPDDQYNYSQAEQQQYHQHTADSTFDEYMKYEDEDDHQNMGLPGFGQEYSSQQLNDYYGQGNSPPEQ